MSSPFPGMDPYIESQGYWEDFHSALLGDCRRALTAVLPRHYGAFIEQRISLVDLSDEPSQAYRPDTRFSAGITARRRRAVGPWRPWNRSRFPWRSTISTRFESGGSRSRESPIGPW